MNDDIFEEGEEGMGEEEIGREERKAFEAYLVKVTEERDNWIEKWPDYCEECDGWGIFEWTEPHGERLSEPCPAMVPTGCHRCGDENSVPYNWETEETTGPCKLCGWKPGEDGLPNY
jgi:hypothetical protein